MAEQRSPVRPLTVSQLSDTASSKLLSVVSVTVINFHAAALDRWSTPTMIFPLAAARPLLLSSGLCLRTTYPALAV